MHFISAKAAYVEMCGGIMPHRSKLKTLISSSGLSLPRFMDALCSSLVACADRDRARSPLCARARTSVEVSQVSRLCGIMWRYYATLNRNERKEIQANHLLSLFVRGVCMFLAGTGATLTVGSSTPRASRVPICIAIGSNSEVNQREKSPPS